MQYLACKPFRTANLRGNPYILLKLANFSTISLPFREIDGLLSMNKETANFANYPSLSGRVVLATGGTAASAKPLWKDSRGRMPQFAFLDNQKDSAEALIWRISEATHPAPLSLPATAPRSRTSVTSLTADGSDSMYGRSHFVTNLRRNAMAIPSPGVIRSRFEGSGTGASSPRISPPGNRSLWMFEYAMPPFNPAISAASAPTAVPPPKLLRKVEV